MPRMLFFHQRRLRSDQTERLRSDQTEKKEYQGRRGKSKVSHTTEWSKKKRLRKDHQICPLRAH